MPCGGTEIIMKIAEEFKTFIARGNVMDMAVGVIMGSAFTKIVNSLVSDILTPIIGLATGKVDLSNLKIDINEQLIIPYGQFLQSIIDFLIVAAVVFFVIKGMNTLKAKLEKQKDEEEAEEEVTPSNEELLLTEIRDLLKDKQ